MSKVWIPDLLYLRDKEAHHSQAPGSPGRSIHWLQIAPAGDYSSKDLLLQGVQGKHWNSRPNVAPYAGGTSTLYCHHTGAECHYGKQELHC